MLWGDWRVCTFESPRSSLNKISCTRQFESKLSLRSFAKSLDKRRIFRKPTFNSLYDPFGSPYRGQKPSGTRGCNRPTVLNFLPLRLSCKESSTFSPSPSSSGSGDVTALWCSEPLRYKVGGASKPSPCFAGWDRLGHKQ